MEDLSLVLKALSDKTRLKIVYLLLEYDFCVGALAKNLGLSEATVSQHLKVLRKAGLVSGEKRGYYTHYNLNTPLFEEAAKALEEIASCTKKRHACRLEQGGNHEDCVHYGKAAKAAKNPIRQAPK